MCVSHCVAFRFSTNITVILITNDIETLMFDCTRRLYYQLKTMIGITIRAKNS